MKYIPYSCQTISAEDINFVAEAMRSEFLTQGARVSEFENFFIDYHQCGYAVAVSSATAGLHLGCLALGIKPGDIVWTSPNSFVASANCALYCGASIDFVDIDSATRNMSLKSLKEKLHIAELAGLLPKLVIPVDFGGFSCDMREIRSLADKYGFFILEDASHATGARYLGNSVGAAWADITVFSFHAIKIITTGEGGMITTHNPVLEQKIRRLRSHGINRELDVNSSDYEGPWQYEQIELGFNYRLTDFQSALGLSQLSRLNEFQASRQLVATQYDELLRLFPLKLPQRFSDRDSSWHLYVVEIDDEKTQLCRKDLFEHLRNSGVGVNVHYFPIHMQPYYQKLGFKKKDFPCAENYYQHAISLPIYPSLNLDQQNYIVEAIGNFFKGKF
jgi:UDP-4-amino-4,6-dideoxy-N-acetyl-beta-L-altrosamine transaminase